MQPARPYTHAGQHPPDPFQPPKSKSPLLPCPGMYYVQHMIHTCCINVTHWSLWFQQKPGYETQIQMLQMMEPSDNDYIYIDFKDFKYNQKLEFPRENLELGTGFKINGIFCVCLAYIQSYLSQNITPNLHIMHVHRRSLHSVREHYVKNKTFEIQENNQQLGVTPYCFFLHHALKCFIPYVLWGRTLQLYLRLQ